MIMARSRTIAALAIGMIFAWTLSTNANDGLDAHRYLDGKRPPIQHLNPSLRENQRIKANPLRRSSVVNISTSDSVELEDAFRNSNVARILLFDNDKQQTAQQRPESEDEVIQRNSSIPIISASHRKPAGSDSSAVIRSASSCTFKTFFASSDAPQISIYAIEWTIHHLGNELTDHARSMTGVVLPLGPMMDRLISSVRLQYIDASHWIEDRLNWQALQQAREDWQCDREFIATNNSIARPSVPVSNTQTFVFEDALTLNADLLIGENPFESASNIELIETIKRPIAPAMLSSFGTAYEVSEPNAGSASLGLFLHSIVDGGQAAIAQLSDWLLIIAYRAERLYEGLEQLIFGSPLGRIWDQVLHGSDGELALD